MPFNIGDLVKVKNMNRKGKVAEVYPPNGFGEREYYVEFGPEVANGTYTLECNLESYDAPPSKLPSECCTCGAKYTSFPNFHSDWCSVPIKDRGKL